MKTLIVGILLLYSTLLWADNTVDVKIDPQNPIAGENFTLLFEINTNFEGKPYISFDPGGLNVLGREERGVAISTTIVNGKFSTKRTIKYAYELVSPRAGRFNIRNIEVELGNKKIKAKGISIQVNKEAPRARNVFVLADVSKTDVYLGEGIDVRYYLYYKIPVGGTEIKEFPKLNRFIKRFHMTNERIETVQYQGEIYKRVLKYSARVYPEKTGKAYIDSLRLNVQYSDGYTNSPFGSFGLQLRKYRTRSISSARVDINVKPLPSENVPPSFTGLVGRHDFKVGVNRVKHIVNEPIELRLTVTGPGALENLDAPNIYSHPELEKFDTKTEMNELNRQTGSKVFEYTYLARNEMQIDNFKKELSYFNPESNRYETVVVDVPGITVGGGSAANRGVLVNSNKDSSQDQGTSSPTTKEIVNVERGLVGPIFHESFETRAGGVFSILNWIFSILLAGLVLSLLLEHYRESAHDDDFVKLCKKIKKNGINYSNLFDLMEKLREVVPEGQKKAISEIVASTTADEETKNYFKYIVEESEKSTFDDGKARNLNYDEKYFKSLMKYYEKQKRNENTGSQSAEF